MKILNFGSINIDYVYAVEHFVSAGETLSSSKMEKFPGGKGLNQSVALARAGAEVYHAGMVGNDADFIIELMEKSGVKTELLRRVDSPSGHAIIQVDPSGENCILLFGGANGMITEEYAAGVLENFSAGDMLVLQNEINNLDYIIKAAKSRGMIIALNPSPMNSAVLSLPLELIDIFLINKIEGREITGKIECEEILRAMSEKFPKAEIVLTLGSEGSCYWGGGQTYTQPIFKVKAVDTTAAGDTFTGFFLKAVTDNLHPRQALRLAAKASSITVTKMGAASSIPYIDELDL